MKKQIINGNCLEVLKGLSSESVDAIVTDPPYELGFMGKAWDATGIAYNVELWRECLRVLKAGGHLLAFGGTRTYHRMAVAIEDAGFEVRDMLEWIYASGFPKSLNIGKAVDKLQGNEREEYLVDFTYPDSNNWGDCNKTGDSNKITIDQVPKQYYEKGKVKRSKGNSEWEGFGTALKPAHEPIVMARKPLSEKTIVENVLKHGTGGLDIDGCRIPIGDITKEPNYRENANSHNRQQITDNRFLGALEQRSTSDDWVAQGRFPANIICTDDALNDGEMTKTGGSPANHPSDKYINNGIFANGNMTNTGNSNYGNDSGSKSRYFDIDVWAEKHGLLQFPKASKRERNEGCEGLEEKGKPDNYIMPKLTCSVCGSKRIDLSNKLVCGCNGETHYEQQNSKDSKNNLAGGNKNNHPTVKPVHLMAWLVRLVSKEGDTVLDPFAGSGTTGVACNKLNRNFILIEQNEEYIEIIKKRVEDFNKNNNQLTLFRN